MRTDRKETTSEVAQRLGLLRNSLTTYLTRHPDLRPAERLPNGDFLWGPEDVERLIERRQRRKVTAS